jgi:hypothetical protein
MWRAAEGQEDVLLGALVEFSDTDLDVWSLRRFAGRERLSLVDDQHLGRRDDASVALLKSARAIVMSS